MVKGGQSSWRKEAQRGVLREGAWEGPQLRGGGLWTPGGALEWAWPAGRGFLGTGPPLPSSAYPGALGLDGFDVQAVLRGLAGAAGLGALLGALAARLSAGLRVPVLLEQQGAEVHVVALLLGHVSVGAVHGFHVLPERAGVRVALGAAWDLADVGFLGEKREAFRTGQKALGMGHSPRKPCRFLWQSLAAPAGGVPPVCSQAIWMGGACPAACVHRFRQVSMWPREPATSWGQRSETGGRDRAWRDPPAAPARARGF